MFGRPIDAWSEDVGVDIMGQTRAFAAEVGDILEGTNTYRFVSEEES